MPWQNTGKMQEKKLLKKVRKKKGNQEGEEWREEGQGTAYA